MKIKWLGHAAFLITTDSGIRIVTDPYHTGERLKYGEINESADIVTLSHEHADHNNFAAVKGSSEAIRGAGRVMAKGIEIRGIATYHDDADGSKRGTNTVFCFEIDGMNVCHLGDLGHPLTAKQLSEVGPVDVLLTPICGFYTIDATTATELVDRLKPRVTIPMHFKNSECDYPVAGVDEFLRGKQNVACSDTSEVEFKKEALPDSQILVLKPAL
jgi:L-ascorbate metabolism protein UlaG (beta-lactamase superfamily)